VGRGREEEEEQEEELSQGRRSQSSCHEAGLQGVHGGGSVHTPRNKEKEEEEEEEGRTTSHGKEEEEEEEEEDDLGATALLSSPLDTLVHVPHAPAVPTHTAPRPRASTSCACVQGATRPLGCWPGRVRWTSSSSPRLNLSNPHPQG